MPTKFKNSIARVRRVASTPAIHDDVHFHLASDGHAFVCDVRGCDSVQLSLSEVHASPQAG
jgi:hypothetical protein